MAAAETLKLSPALQRFLAEGSDDDLQEDDHNLHATLALGDLDISTSSTSLRGQHIPHDCILKSLDLPFYVGLTQSCCDMEDPSRAAVSNGSPSIGTKCQDDSFSGRP